MEEEKKKLAEGEKKAEAFLSKPYIAAAITAFFSTALSGEIQGLFQAGKYLKAIEYALIGAIVPYLMFAIGYSSLSVFLGRSELFQKAGKWKKWVAVAYAISTIFNSESARLCSV